nr:sugar transporter stl1 [Quercus suber]
MIVLEGSALLHTVALLSCLGFLLVGFDNGLMGGLVNGAAFDRTFGIDATASSGANLIALIVAIYDIGCFFGAVFCSIFGKPHPPIEASITYRSITGERLGRRRSILIGVLVMIVGALLQASAYVSAHMIVARIVSGLGMGLINSTVPVLMAEFAPKATRGIFVCAQLSTLNFGIMCVITLQTPADTGLM